MNRSILMRLWALLLVLVALQTSAYAQDDSRITDFARPGRPTMLIYVWGTASTPGIWKVEQDVDPVELLSAAQIANFGNIDSSVKQTMFLSIYRKQGSRREEIYKAQMTDFLTGAAPAPPLMEEDLLLVETVTKDKFNLQTIFSAIAAVGSIVLLIIRVRQL